MYITIILYKVLEVEQVINRQTFIQNPKQRFDVEYKTECMKNEIKLHL